MARKTCMDCVRKHIAQAVVLMDEAHLGYPHHKWYAVGHLAEAESEARAEFSSFAHMIRGVRLSIMNGGTEPNFDKLMITACKMAGEKLIYDKNNSKDFSAEGGGTGGCGGGGSK